jgi:hypothetical protein
MKQTRRLHRPKLDGIIRLTKVTCHLRGKRRIVYDMIRDGMTVDNLKAKAAKRFHPEPNWNLRTARVLRVCIDEGLITVTPWTRSAKKHN